ncbi:MAG: ArnT family glycosyltransferase [Candidatus Methylomirabilales bacterium]
MPKPAGPPAFGRLLLLAAVAVLYLWGLGDRGFQDPDEGMYAEIAREMATSGDWVVPRFNGVPYVEKPPLVYWLTAGSFLLLGPSEFAARLWKVLPILGTLALTMVLGGRLISPRAALPAGLILATGLGTYLFSRISQMDPMHAFGVTLAAAGIAQAGPRAGRAAGYAFWTGTALAVLSKGLPGLFFPAALAAGRTLTHGGAALRGLRAWRPILLAGALVLPWHVAVAARVPGFVGFYLWDNQVLRFLGRRAYAEDGTGLATWAFLAVTAFCLLPWLPYLGAAAWRRQARGERERNRLFLLSWVAAVLGLFALSSFKLEYYALPAFPAVALLVAGLLDQAAWPASPSEGAATRRQLRAWTWVGILGGLVFTGAAAWLWAGQRLTPEALVQALALWSTNYRVILDQGLALPGVSPGFFAGIAVGGGAAWVAAFTLVLVAINQGRIREAALLVGATGLLLCVLGASVLRAVEPHHSLKPLARHLAAAARPEDRIVHERGLEKGGGLVFYLGRPVLVLNGTRGDLEFGSRLPGTQGMFLDAARFAELWRGPGRVFVVTDLPLARSAVGAAEPRPVLLASTPTRWLYANR